MDDEIPPLLPPDQMPPIHSPHDMHRHWRALMGELGFSQRLLWFGFVTAEGWMAPQLHQVEDLPPEPIVPFAANLIAICRRVLDEVFDPAGSVAFLLSRPGSAQMTTSDRTWARALATAAAHGEVRLQPIHLATDQAVRVFAADDLIGPRGA
jgi:hypothetical protein